MAFNSAPTSSYFGINRFVEETKRNEQIITENNDENPELIPGTYMIDQVNKFHLSSCPVYWHFDVCFSISKKA